MHTPLNLPPLADLAGRAGMSGGGRSGWGPCPLCRADRRGKEDRRAPLAIFAGRDGERWTCHACKAGGDAVAFLAAVQFGEVPGKGDPRWPEIFAELRGEPGAAVAGAFLSRVGGWGKRPPTAPRMASDTCEPVGNAPNREAGRPAVAPPDEERPAPPLEEVRALWAACGRLDAPGVGYATEPAIPYLACPDPGRELPVDMLAALDLVRLVPRSGPRPSWIPLVGMSSSEWAAVYRLAVPMYDACGELRAVRFRAVDWVREPSAGGMRWRSLNVPRARKALAGRGTRLAGLVIADPMALALLRRSNDDAPVDDGGATWDGRIVIAEGEPDAWTWATVQRRRRWAREREAGTNRGATWAVFGVIAGSWTPEIAARIPDGAEVVVRVHSDPAGDRYAAQIIETLAGRCRVSRSVPPPDPDGDPDGHA